MIIIKKYAEFFLIFLSIFSIILLGGCTKDMGENRIMRYDVKSPASSIDPQFSTSDTAKIVIANTFEGLFRYNEQGEIENVLVTDYTVTDDGLVYTFHIKKGTKWSNETDVTAKDFEFAFKRMFDQEALSPFAVNYISIKNAEEILNGNMPKYSLGVKASDDYTLKIHLEKPNPYFISLLTHNSAMPCNEDFLIKAKGRYGLDRDNIISNGPFKLRSWDNNEIKIRRNIQYFDADSVVCAGVNFYIGRENPDKLFMEDKTDGSFIAENALEQAKKDKKNIIEFENTTMQVIFNQKNTIFENEKIRQAFIKPINVFEIESGDFFETDTNLIPEIIQSPMGKYREVVGDLKYDLYTNMDAKESLREGLKELGLKKTGKITILLPDNIAGKKAVLELQKVWAKEISVYVNFELLPENQLMKRVENSDYQIALISISPQNDSAISVVHSFTSSHDLNYANMNDPVYDQIIYDAMHSEDIKSSLDLIYSAEQYLIDRAVVLPIFSSNKYFAMNKDVSDIQVSVYEGTCYFKNARRKD